MEHKKMNTEETAKMRSFTSEEIQKQAKVFCDKWIPKWKKNCDVCKGCNCNNNDTCIHCGCQF